MKQLLIAFILLAFSLGINAQEFGLHLGGNISNVHAVSGNTNWVTSSIYTYQGGFLLRFDANKKTNIHTGLIYNLKGYSTNSLILGAHTRSISYVDIPLSIAFNYKINRKLKAYIEPGIYMGIGLSGKDVYDNLNSETNIEFGTEAGQDSRINQGLSLGAGINYKQIKLGVAYQFGLTDLFGNTDLQDAYQRVFSLGLSLFFKG